MGNKHTASDLAQMQAMPLEAKIRMTKMRIRDWYEYWNGQVCVSFSGGKDSTVLKHLVDSMYSDVPAIFVNTGLEYPEIQRFVKDVLFGEYDCFNPDVVILRPEMRFDEVVKTYGYPVISKRTASTIELARKNIAEGKNDTLRVRLIRGQEINEKGQKSIFNAEKWEFMLDAPFKVSSKCCNVMKKKPLKKYQKETKRHPFIGTMASESKQRMMNWLLNGCNAFDANDPTSQPMSFWTEQDVLEYIVKYEVPYASVYGQIQAEGELEGQMFIDGFHQKLCTSGVDRTGCMFCMFGCHLDKLGTNGDKNRFQIMKETHPNQYAYCMKPVEEGGLGIKEVLKYIGVPYE